MISESTHKSGGVIDLLFSNVPHLVDNLRILGQNEVCLSDHRAIGFKVALKLAYSLKLKGTSIVDNMDFCMENPVLPRWYHL